MNKKNDRVWYFFKPIRWAIEMVTYRKWLHKICVRSQKMTI